MIKRIVITSLLNGNTFYILENVRHIVLKLYGAYTSSHQQLLRNTIVINLSHILQHLTSLSSLLSVFRQSTIVAWCLSEDIYKLLSNQ